MSEKDKELIKRAWAVHYTDWFTIDTYIEQAESESAKDYLKSIRMHKYHQEEYKCGLD